MRLNLHTTRITSMISAILIICCIGLAGCASQPLDSESGAVDKTPFVIERDEREIAPEDKAFAHQLAEDGHRVGRARGCNIDTRAASDRVHARIASEFPDDVDYQRKFAAIFAQNASNEANRQRKGKNRPDCATVTKEFNRWNRQLQRA